jgi:DNA-binding Lrp family transcriptional regulator
LSRVVVRIDEVDLQILKILTNDCRASYHNIAKTLGISANTARTRINNLIVNKTIEQFFTIVNFSLFGYSEILTILLKVNNRHNDIDKVAKTIRHWGPIYTQIEIFDRVHVFSIAIREGQINKNNIDTLRENLSKSLGKNISIVDLFSGEPTSLVSEKFNLRRIDLEIIVCLLSDPRMTFLNIARTLGCSQKTVIRRIEKLKSGRVILGFSLQYNPSNMKAYNYFSVVVHTRSGMAAEVIKEISYSKLNEYVLRFPPFNYHNRVIINFHIQNVFDIESIVSRIRSIEGVVKADAYQPVRIKWHEDWLKKKIRNKIQNIIKSKT